ncbi:MAG: OmpA family protein, partial [Bacteroidota bacterium]
FWQLPALILYNGNVLLDNASSLVPMNCDDEPGPRDPIVMLDPPTNPNPGQVIEPVPIDQRPKGGNTPPPPPAVETVKLGETEAELKVDAVFQIEDITFKANSAELELLSEGALQEIVQFLRHNRGVTVEIGGHANIEAGNTYATEISTSRAKSVVQYLRRHGIAPERLFPHGYGKERPVCLDRTPACQRRNQRVEVKIIRMEEKEGN